MNNGENSFIIPIREITKWSNEKKSNCGILAEIPILQRGLVWNQSQIELLWDSILRGIPIGSIVLCEISDSIKIQSKGKIKDATHFILDGQQRCNAITLGFNDFNKVNATDSIIWLDLDTKSSNANSTREYLTRLTTLAHPWGFNKSDEAGRLGVRMIRENIEKFNKDNNIDFAQIKRFKPREIFPFEAQFPIPLSILLNSSENNFWLNIKNELQQYDPIVYPWAKIAYDFIDSDKIDKNKIQRAVERAKNTNIIALSAPNTLLDSTNQETNEGINEGITNIEHLFQRLNRQGTNLDGEELVYSMMKSYFPEIAETIDKVAFEKMPASKMLQLSVRVALSDQNGLKGKYNVSQIRRLATSIENGEKEKVISFINDKLESVTQIVDMWLGTKDHAWGLPAVLKTGIAISSSDVYSLLLYLAWKYPSLEEEQYRRITGFTLFIHWFVDENEKGRVVSIIYKDIFSADDETILSRIYESINKNENINSYIKRLQNPYTIENIIVITKANVENWRWSDCKTIYHKIKSDNGDSKNEEVNNLEFDKYINPLLVRIRKERELLLYAQRNYLRIKFREYDPARKDLWLNINRPWDFDHIMPSSYFYNKKGIYSHLEVCKQFYGTIGNLRAWPFEDNRSDQDVKTSDKMKKDEYWHNSFISENEKVGYSDRDVIVNNEKAFNFARTCQSRIIRIYKEWYDNFNIIELHT